MTLQKITQGIYDEKVQRLIIFIRMVKSEGCVYPGGRICGGWFLLFFLSVHGN